MAAFIEPMLLLRSDELPDGPEWLRELKFDGYRAVAIKFDGRIYLSSRNDNALRVFAQWIATYEGWSGGIMLLLLILLLLLLAGGGAGIVWAWTNLTTLLI